ncbi:DUF1045 domain-containing protein [Puniceibacterium sediminis]|uniref:Putative phosphonate metabolism protein n=1 Tax=Puniceibacterium sediminis TaxID=1608407 RepID=A0A238VL33_9RHOB|nr:DUF1045 domain-containing protein [Puniceibacterium sediminis]SNR34827.1 putative phosphonate metabolism protein [Puniceibacterium sediminis]
MTFTRYAIYYTLPPGPLASFGAAWLGWDAANGLPCPPPDIPGLPAPAHDITATPRKYGLHGTIKPPFRLATGTTPAQLKTAFANLCATQPRITLDALALTRLGRFLALTPTGDTSALSDLAAQAVQQLDPFRAPPTDAELQRRNPASLSPRQRELLALYGYPYVLEAFRFHITLTGRLAPDALSATESALRPQLAPLLSAPFHIDALTLCGEDSEGRFHELDRLSLTG